MPTNERGHQVPANTAAPSRAQIFDDFANSLNDVILVADATERTAAIAGLPYTPDATRPAIFWRADATAGKQLEIWDGTTVLVYDARDTGWTTLTANAGYTLESGSAVRRIGDQVFVRGRANRGTGNVISGDFPVTLGTTFRPLTVDRPKPGVGSGSAFFKWLVQTSGNMTVFSTPTVSTTYVHLDLEFAV